MTNYSTFVIPGANLTTSTSESCLTRDATPEDQWKALRLNAEAWYERYALSERKCPVDHVGEILLTCSHATIPSEAALDRGEAIDYILEWYRKQRTGTILWYLNPTPPVKLGPRLLARGVSTNWRPHWMWCDLSISKELPSSSTNIEICIINSDYIGSCKDEEERILCRLADVEPRRVWYIAAFQNGIRLGKCIINATVSDYGICGLFDMWVEPEHQRQGLGTMLAVTSRKLAKQLGYRYMFLNSTDMGESIYRKVGFQSIGQGYTWHLKDSFHETDASSNNVKFLEAVALGNISVLDQVYPTVTQKQLCDPTINKMTPMEIAVYYEKVDSAKWLLSHGAIPDIISLWTLGLKDQARTQIRERPSLINAKHGDFNGTPLHTAIERNDLELVDLLMTSADIDLNIKDDVFKATPLQWAEHFDRPGIIAKLQEK